MARETRAICARRASTRPLGAGLVRISLPAQRRARVDLSTGRWRELPGMNLLVGLKRAHLTCVRGVLSAFVWKTGRVFRRISDAPHVANAVEISRWRMENSQNGLNLKPQESGSSSGGFFGEEPPDFKKREVKPPEPVVSQPAPLSESAQAAAAMPDLFGGAPKPAPTQEPAEAPAPEASAAPVPDGIRSCGCMEVLHLDLRVAHCLP